MWPFEGHVWYLQPRSVLDADPSVRDGVDAGQVARDKHDACRFISKIGRRLHLYAAEAPARAHVQPLPDDCVLAALLSPLLRPPLDEELPAHGLPVLRSRLTR